MDVIANLTLGIATALDPANILYCFVGVLVGTAIGVLPGIGPSATISMLLPLTFALPAETSLIMLAGIYYGAQYGGSTTAILVNMPGEASSVATSIDGYQMTRQGRAGAALAAAALGSFFAGTVATVIVALAAVPLTELALEFQAAEYFALMVLGLVCSIALAHGAVLNALAMILVGILLGSIGTDLYTGAQRFTGGFTYLLDGVDFVALSIGLFGVSEIIRNLETEMPRGTAAFSITRLLPTRAELATMAWPIVRGTGIGAVLGILPGGGAILGSFAAYSMEKAISPTPERFGNGAIEGVAAPEAANNAGAQTSFIPMLTLGIPGTPVMALMIGALMIHGIAPGPNIMTQQPALFWGVIASMWVGNLMLVVLNLPLIGLWARLLAIPYHFLFPTILVFCCIGVYSTSGSALDIFVALGFGVLGYALVKLGCEVAPMMLGFILGPMLEENLRRAMILARGDIASVVSRPITALVLVASVLLLFVVLLPALRGKRTEIFVED